MARAAKLNVQQVARPLPNWRPDPKGSRFYVGDTASAHFVSGSDDWGWFAHDGGGPIGSPHATEEAAQRFIDRWFPKDGSNIRVPKGRKPDWIK